MALKFKFYFFVFLSLLLTLNSCFSVKTSATKTVKKYYEEFYLGENGNQYFLKPLEFVNDTTEASILFDFTFKYLTEIKDSATVNFTIESTEISKQLSHCSIKNKKVEAELNNIELLFNEKNKNQFKSRFTSQMSLEELVKLFKSHKWTISVGNGNDQFVPTKKSEKIIAMINDNLFSFIN